MSNTTAAPGYLTPTGQAIDQTTLENALQAMVVGVTGLAAGLVRPRWQPKPPKTPGRDVTWCAIGVTDFTQSRSSVAQDGADVGQAVVTTWTGLTLLATFYGPGALGAATRLRDGLLLGQNRDALRAQGLALGDLDNLRNVPEQRDGLWQARVDLPLTMQWETRQQYGVLNITAANGTIVTDTGETNTF